MDEPLSAVDAHAGRHLFCPNIQSLICVLGGPSRRRVPFDPLYAVDAHVGRRLFCPNIQSLICDPGGPKMRMCT